MSQDDPWLILLVAGISAWLFRQWVQDYRDARKGSPHPRALPGAVPCAGVTVAVAVLGALVLLAVETLGENRLGVSAQQKDITGLFLVAMVAAAFYEELMFRGFLVVENRGRAALLAGIFGCSALFALLHPFLWDWKDGAFVLDFSTKACWSTTMVFVFSLWQYTVRCFGLNPRRSLIPCFAGHLAKNLGVFAIKLAQGHVTGWW